MVALRRVVLHEHHKSAPDLTNGKQARAAFDRCTERMLCTQKHVNTQTRKHANTATRKHVRGGLHALGPPCEAGKRLLERLDDIVGDGGRVVDEERVDAVRVVEVREVAAGRRLDIKVPREPAAQRQTTHEGQDGVAVEHGAAGGQDGVARFCPIRAWCGAGMVVMLV